MQWPTFAVAEQGILIKDAPTTPTRQRRRIGRRLAFVLLLGLFVPVWCCYAWYQTAVETPLVQIPNPVLPIPNGFDTLCAAGNQLLDPRKIGYAVASTHGKSDKDDRAYTPEEQIQFVQENSKSLKLLRKALSEQYCNPPVRSGSIYFPYYPKYRQLACLLQLDAHAMARHHDYGGAISSALDAMEMGELIQHGSTLFGGSAGQLCQAIGRISAWECVDHLSADQARRALRRLEAIQQHQVKFWTLLQEEKWSGQANLLEVFRTPAYVVPVAMNSSEADLTTDPRLHPAIAGLFYLRYSKRQAMEEYTATLDRAIASAKLPYHPSMSDDPEPYNPLVRIMGTTSYRARFAYVKAESENDLLAITLAIRAYRLTRGHIPNALSELRPEYLKTLPSDPFGPGKPFNYRPLAKDYLLYSIGPDGKDDGGTAIDKGSERYSGSKYRYAVSYDSKGDIVAKKNTW